MGGMELGRTLVIANPAAQSGRGEQGAEYVRRYFSGYAASYDVRIKLTSAPGDGVQLARAASGYDTVIALGGDGVIHEVVNGLMKIGVSLRPLLGVIPLGSGNDYARSLGMSINRPETALGQIMQGVCRRVDLGIVNGTYFAQTLSFGLDAAIALDTVSRRREHGARGTRLFAGSGLRQITGGLRPWRYAAQFDGRRCSGSSIVFAVQVGPTYGGGFRICPDADLSDGELDCCRSEGVPSVAYALGLFALARFGRHTGSRYLRFERFSSGVVEFEQEPPAQADGERLGGTRFEIGCKHRALEVIVPTWHL